MKKLAVLTLALLILSACAENKKSAGKSAFSPFVDRYAHEKAEPTSTEGEESVIVDRTGELFYRYNANKYCLVTAIGKIKQVVVAGENYLVTYSYSEASHSGDVALCPVQSGECHEMIAVCEKTATLIRSRANLQYTATIALAERPATAAKRLTPYRF